MVRGSTTPRGQLLFKGPNKIRGAKKRPKRGPKLQKKLTLAGFKQGQKVAKKLPKKGPKIPQKKAKKS
jgi:hypothetical protein